MGCRTPEFSEGQLLGYINWDTFMVCQEYYICRRNVGTPILCKPRGRPSKFHNTNILIAEVKRNTSHLYRHHRWMGVDILLTEIISKFGVGKAISPISPLIHILLHHTALPKIWYCYCSITC